MSVAAAIRTAAPSNGLSGGENRFLLGGITWSLYEAISAELGDHSSIRLAYDRGSLELMAPSFRHEDYAKLIGIFIGVLAEELNIPIRGARCTTLKREDLQRGLEPDDCYYIAHESAIRDNVDIDLRRDPPPDLAIEVDISASSLDQLSIYAALGVAEVWQYDGVRLHTYRLAPSGHYEPCRRSLAFPFLPLGEFARFLEHMPGTDETTLRKKFRKWVQDEVAPHARDPVQDE